MADFIFDGDTKRITEPVGSGDTVFDVDRDIYSAWKRWTQIGDNSKYLPAFSVEGGTPIGATGLFTGTTFILTNGWKIVAADHAHQCILNGNLFSDDGVVSDHTQSKDATIFVNASVAAQGVATSVTNNNSNNGGGSIDEDALANRIIAHIWAAS
jgi:hypothetical protein